MKFKRTNGIKKKKAGTTRIVDTHIFLERRKDADQLEKQRLSVNRELEEVMAEYAELTGYKKLKGRKYKVGDAPNDWKKL